MKTDIPKTGSMGSRQGLTDHPSLNGKRNTEKSKAVPVGLMEVNGEPFSKLLSFGHRDTLLVVLEESVVRRSQALSKHSEIS